jgi:D-alanyl-D-alanine carboxypeptidase
MSSIDVRRAPWLLSACLFAPVAALAQALPDAAQVARYAQTLLDEQGIDPQGPGVTLLVARGDQLLATAARGQASIELGVPLRPEHVLRLGSITKQFAAATLLRLVDEGRASLDDPLSKYLPGYPNGQAITLVQLLNHSSGVKSYTGIAGYMVEPIRRDLTTAQLVAEFQNLPVDFAPGTRWAYNNSGYVLVGAVIEAITGKPWHETLHEQLLAPAKVAVVYPAPSRLVPSHVAGYTRGEQGTAPAGLLSMTQPHAAGALVGNAESLWRWNQALHEGQLLKPATYQRMVTPEGVAVPARYGFGIGTDLVRGMPVLQHGGGINGFSTLLHYLPTQRITVAVLRNSDRGGASLDVLARQLGAYAAGKPYPKITPLELPVAALKAYEGVYSQGPVTRTLRVVDGRLTSQRGGGAPLSLLPLGSDRFAFTNSVAQVQFQRGADGRVTGQVHYTDGDALGAAEPLARTADLTVTPEVALSEPQRQALLGQYLGGPLNLSVFVDAQGVLRSQLQGQPAVTLKATGPRELYVVEVDATLSFAPAEGEVQTVVLKQGLGRFELKRKR